MIHHHHAGAAVAASFVLLCGGQPSGAEPLDPNLIPKYVDALVIPPVMKPVGQGGAQAIVPPGVSPAVQYRIAVRQFNQQVLPTQGYGGDDEQPFPMTTVWGYGRAGDQLPGGAAPSSFNYPAFTVETRTNQRVRVTWLNQLVDTPAPAALTSSRTCCPWIRRSTGPTPRGPGTPTAPTLSRTSDPCPS